MDVFVSAEAFVRAWQSSSSVAEVACKLQMKKSQVRLRACRYRKHGVRLKEYPPALMPASVDWEELRQVAAALMTSGPEARVANSTAD